MIWPHVEYPTVQLVQKTCKAPYIAAVFTESCHYESCESMCDNELAGVPGQSYIAVASRRAGGDGPCAAMAWLRRLEWPGHCSRFASLGYILSSILYLFARMAFRFAMR